MTYDTRLLTDPQVHLLRLGTLSDNGQLLLSVSSQPSNTPRTWDLTRWRHGYLSSLRAAVATTSREYTVDEGALVLELAELGVITAVDERNGFGDLDAVVPVLRKTILPVVDTEDGGGDFRTEDSAPFHVTEFGAHVLARTDNMTTLGRIAADVAEEFADGEDGSDFVRDTEVEYGRPYTAALLLETLALVDSLAASGAVTFEPKGEA